MALPVRLCQEHLQGSHRFPIPMLKEGVVIQVSIKAYCIWCKQAPSLSEVNLKTKNPD